MSSPTESSPHFAPSGGTSRPRVIIIGTGIAGLSAAQTLMGCNINDFLLLEGRPRIGGRIYTDVIGSGGVPINLGAHFIHGCDTPGCNLLLDFCKKHNILTVDASKVNEQYFAGDAPGHVIPDSAVEAASACSTHLDEELWSTARHSDTLEQALTAAPEIVQLKEEERLVFEHLVTAKHAYAASPKDVSLAGVRDQLKRHHHRALDAKSCGDRILPYGFSRVVQMLVRGVARNIVFNQAVTRVEQSDAGCAVFTSTGEMYQCDAVIVTVSLGVLKSGMITFSPPLSAPKQQAIDKLGFGVQNRIYLNFENIFWDNSMHAFHCCNDVRFQIFNMSAYGLGPMLSAIVRPPFSSTMEEMCDEDVIKEIMAVLHRMFENAEEPISYRITRWGSDPFARGSFSYIPCGASMKEVEVLSAPEGRLYFAGEATSDEEMQMARGAFTSGIRAGYEVQSLLRKLGHVAPPPVPAPTPKTAPFDMPTPPPGPMLMHPLAGQFVPPMCWHPAAHPFFQYMRPHLIPTMPWSHGMFYPQGSIPTSAPSGPVGAPDGSYPGPLVYFNYPTV